jgi:anti-sigma regulatory factor (Ser/Thr protein kinase)
MSDSAKVLLHMGNGPENVTLVRETLTGLSEYARFARGELNDIRTAVTEACNNVVLHAYEDEEGPLEVEIGLSGQTTEVVVRDEGSGIQPRIRAIEDGPLGIGLAVIQALVRSVEFSDSEGRGTEVRMRFDTHVGGDARENGSAGEGTPQPAVPLARWAIAPSELARTTGITIAPVACGRSHQPGCDHRAPDPPAHTGASGCRGRPRPGRAIGGRRPGVGDREAQRRASRERRRRRRAPRAADARQALNGIRRRPWPQGAPPTHPLWSRLTVGLTPYGPDWRGRRDETDPNAPAPAKMPGQDPTGWRWAGDWEEEADARSIVHAYPRRWPPGDATTARGRTTPVPICPQRTYSKHDSSHSPFGRRRWAGSCGA